MEGQFRNLIRQKIMDSLAATVAPFTRRDIRLPGVKGKAVAVIGMRRTGKTTFLWQIVSDRLAKGTGREGLLYFSFEDERLADMTAADLHLVVEEYYRLHPEWRDQRKAVFLLDEIQVVRGWETFVRRLLDTEQVELFLSGSSARLLSREVATSMRGRAMEALVHPFSFREYLRHFGREPERDLDRLTKAARSRIEKDLREYLIRGGFPEAVDVAPRDRFELLRGYVDTALLRDVIERHAVSHPVALRWMVRHLLGNAAGPFSVNKFHGDLRSQGIPVAKDTLHAYLSYLEDAFLIRTVAISSASARRRMVNPRKVYPMDPALIPVFDRTGRANLGHALETCVLLELERRGTEIAYVRTSEGYEVDFLARYPDNHQELIQVCADLSDPATRQREIRALQEAAREYPRAAPHLVSLEPEVPADMPPGITVHSATAWLLSRGEE
ncbi:MAG: ATP-binding protein [Alphaproteobacteria bacterium]|uniref:ATP-binding protein n=1 Tax=Candidatus Nitrobium versatile TaxID=2884831 RepID=A0A953J9T2_9BACT|nr:ATP-binding protein [Candidatus Nitrobium versatile]